MNTALTIVGLGAIAGMIYGISLGREMRKQSASPEGVISDMKTHADPGTGVVLVSGTVQNNGVVPSDYETTVVISQRDGWSVDYSINVRAVLYSSTGAPLDRKSASTYAGTPGARPKAESGALHWFDKTPDGGWTKPRNRVERTPTSTVRIGKQLEASGASAVGASNSMSPNRIFGRGDLAS